MKGQFIILFLLAISTIDKSCSFSIHRLALQTACPVNALLHLRTIKYSSKSSPIQTSHEYKNTTSLVLLLLLSGDIQSNPGPRPPKFPCGICAKAVKWDHMHPSVCCDSCDVWYHQHCMAMPDAVYQGLKNVSWECVNFMLGHT